MWRSNGDVTRTDPRVQNTLSANSGMTSWAKTSSPRLARAGARAPAGMQRATCSMPNSSRRSPSRRWQSDGLPTLARSSRLCPYV